MKRLNALKISIICMLVLFVLNTASPCFAQNAAATTEKSSIVIDNKGEEWIRIPQEGKADLLVRVSEADEKDIINAFNNFDFKSIPMQSLKQFGPEYLKFSAALMMVQMSTCFGTNSSLSSLSPIASAATPTCVDDFLTHLVDWKGWVGFYFFMLGNRYTSQGLMKIATLSLAHVGKPKSIPALRKKLTPLFGYLGMTGGSLASQVVHHFLSAPSWGQCIELLKEEGLGSVPCKEAYTHFLTVEDFWDDFAAGSMSMITSSIAATVTHKLIGTSGQALKNLPLLAKRGLRIVGGNSKAIDLVAKYGSKAIKVLRVGKNITVATGVPGVVVFVVTELGQFVLFLAWDEVLKNPFSRAYYDWDTSGGVNRAIIDVTSAAKENKKLDWKKPYIVSTKKCTYRQYNKTTKKMESVCSTQHVDPFMSNYMEFFYGAQRYRKKVLLNPIDQAIQGWAGKMSDVIKKYKMSKSLMEHLAKEREKNESRAMNLQESSIYIMALWKNTLEIELPLHPNIPKNVRPLLLNLASALGTNYENLALSKATTVPARTNYFTQELIDAAAAIKLNSQKILAVKEALKALQVYSGTPLENDVQLVGLQCGYLPMLCLAKETTQALDLKNTFESSKESSNIELTEALFGIFGDTLAADTTFEMLCGNGKDVIFKNINNNGRKASLSLPAVIKFERKDFDINCFDYTSLRDKFDFTKEDVLRPWVINGRIYPTAVDMLSSRDVSWIFGKSKTEIDAWWFKTAFQPMSKFLFTMAKQYQTHLNDTFFSEFDDLKPEELVHSSSPQMRGANLVHHIVSSSGIWDRPRLSTSLMAQVNFVMHTAKYYGPATQSKNFDLIKLAFAKYILNLKEAQRIQSMESVWLDYTEKMKLEGTDTQTIINAQDAFDEALSEAVLSKERQKRMLDLRTDIVRLKNELFFQISGTSYAELTGIDKSVFRLRAQMEIE
ncbi:MAG: hypothetical protein IT287_08130, partial [Bdellovibrionaceae bacterium]|nr:hypothetical protein [Pseudobdellovibrionaceae bacterium]